MEGKKVVGGEKERQAYNPRSLIKSYSAQPASAISTKALES